MKWTTEKPTVPGPFWLRCKPGGTLPLDGTNERDLGYGPRLVTVDLLYGLTIVWDAMTRNAIKWMPANCEWCGPIAPPEEGS